MTRQYGFFISIILGLFILTACSQSSFSQNTADIKQNNTVSSQNHEVSKQKSSIPNNISNGVGLGDTISWVESKEGNPSTVQLPIKDGSGEVTYKSNSIQVSYLNGRVQNFEIDFQNDSSLSQAQNLAKNIIPKDSKFIKSYSKNIGGANSKIDVYSSDLLKQIWAADEFVTANGPNAPGEFDVIYTFDTQNNPQALMSVGAAIGDNP